MHSFIRQKHSIGYILFILEIRKLSYAKSVCMGVSNNIKHWYNFSSVLFYFILLREYVLMNFSA